MTRVHRWCPRALALGVVMLGCGPVEYLSQVSTRAANALSNAERDEADRLAPYDYVLAREYYRKAREEAGESQFQNAAEYGRRAEEHALRARALARGKQQLDEGNQQHDRGQGQPVPAEPPPPAVPAEPTR